MPEYSSTTITPADGVKTPAMNGSTSGNYTLSALRDFVLASKGQANGLASLGSDGKLATAQLPDLADDVIVVASYSTLPATGTASKIYITADNNKMYRWDPDLTTPDYVELSVDLTEYAKIVDIQDGNIQAGIAVKAWQDAMGRAIITTYETKAEASDLNDAISQQDARISNLEQEHGGYVTVNYRGTNAVPTGKAKYALVESIVGKSRPWNMQASLQASDWTLSNTSITSSGNVLTVTPTTDSSTTKYALVPVIAGHVYLVAGSIAKNANGGASVAVGFFGSSHSVSHVTASNDSATSVSFSEIYATVSVDAYFEIRPSSSMPTSESADCTKLILRDLTHIFPELTSAEITTLGVAGLVKLCPDLLKYDSFGSSIVNTTVSGVESRGVNIWDEELVIGVVTNNGSVDSSYSSRVTTSFIPVRPLSTYYFYQEGNSNIYSGRYAYYDADKNCIDYDSSGVSSSSKILTTTADTYYIRVTFGSGYGTVYQHDVQIAECPSGTPTSVNTTYHAYMTDTLTFSSSVTLRGIVICEETYDPETGVIDDNKFETVGLGTLSYTPASYGAYSWDLSSVSKHDSPYNWQNGISSKAETWLRLDGALVIYDSSLSSLTSQEIQDALSGYSFMYVKATQGTPSTPLAPVNNPFINTEGGGTINTIQTQTPVIDNSMDVGYLAL